MKTIKEMTDKTISYVKAHKLEVGIGVGIVALAVITKGKTKAFVKEEVVNVVATPDWTVDIVTGDSRTWYLNKLTETPIQEIIDELIAGTYTVE